MNWGNAIVRELKNAGDVITELQLELHLEGNFRKTEKKMTWLAAQGSLLEAEFLEVGYLLTKDMLKGDDLDDYLATDTTVMIEALCRANLVGLKEGDVLQLERKGYFRVDKSVCHEPEGRAVLFKIPTSGKDSS
ncbi:ribosomal protein L25-like protein [Zopfia rhizophila CBS 207.26]|uniref:Ribosomal protein L25-like protein n=1 Tax=Zopfia rhizophila CBS 207.26 TaxID=1314779 RepID=A0A6A6D9T7_9PEZI|nr:ribosomal protein L25-like protein [Zopfia rhizophila CBS 207.26]